MIHGRKLTELKVHASTLDVALGHRRVELDGLAEIGESLLVLAHEAVKGTTEIVGESLVSAKLTEVEGLLEGGGSLLVTSTSLALQVLQAELHLTKAGLLGELNRVLEALRAGLGAEALEVVADEGRAGELRGLGLEDLLGLVLGELLEEALDGLGALLVAEAVDDAAGGEIEKSVAVTAKLVVSIGTAVQGLDVVWVELEGGGGIGDNLLPLGEGIVASGAVGEVDGVGLADDGLGVEFDGLVEVLGTVGLVSELLQLGSVRLALLLG